MELREFGDAATFLRKTNLEQLAAQAHAFDGTVPKLFYSFRFYFQILTLLIIKDLTEIYVLHSILRMHVLCMSKCSLDTLV